MVTTSVADGQCANRVFQVLTRLFDLCLATTVMMFLAWLMAVIALAIRLDSPGPVVFRQTRVGRQGKHFRCYKFRTMFVDAPELPTHQASSESVTRIGRLLRRVKLDELPQLFNVLRGDMAVVGPRPSLPSQRKLVVARLKSGVLRVRPGITGLAQVGRVDMSNLDRLLEVDLDYVNSQTFLLNVKILIATPLGICMNSDLIFASEYSAP